MLMVNPEEMLSPICADSGCPMRKSRIQLQRESSELSDEFGGDNMFSAKLLSINNRLVYCYPYNPEHSEKRVR